MSSNNSRSMNFLRFPKFLAIFALLGVALIGHPAPAEARVSVGIGIGDGCCYGGGWHHGYGYGWGGGPYYYPGYYPDYYAPPPAYYVPAPPTVVYQTAPSPAITQEQNYAPPPAVASDAPVDTSPTYTDNEGRTCRGYETAKGVHRTTCQDPSDGTWHTVK